MTITLSKGKPVAVAFDAFMVAFINGDALVETENGERWRVPGGAVTLREVQHSA